MITDEYINEIIGRLRERVQNGTVNVGMFNPQMQVTQRTIIVNNMHGGLEFMVRNTGNGLTNVWTLIIAEPLTRNSQNLRIHYERMEQNGLWSYRFTNNPGFVRTFVHLLQGYLRIILRSTSGDREAEVRDVENIIDAAFGLDEDDQV